MTHPNSKAFQIDTAIHGLMYAAGQIDLALLGEKRHLNARVAESTGPFAKAMRRLGAIAEGGTIEDIEAARNDLLFAFPLMRHLRGLFYSAMQEVLFAAHVRCADLITREEAQAMLGTYAGWLGLEAALGHIHPIVRAEGQEWQGHDATYLGEPGEWYDVRYAGYEVRAILAKHTQQAEDVSRWRAEQAAREASASPTGNIPTRDTNKERSQANANG